ncbi:MAG TPA: S8 family serine peptidase [Candidatus Acidoferrales bacterium]|nr:S8 family serine peptidase [Candidatus Acidoferrales bacterium]
MKHWVRVAVGALAMILCAVCARATAFTPLEWQQRVASNRNSVFVGQLKNISWSRDRNRDFIDDEIERRFHPGSFVNVVIDLNHCETDAQLEKGFGPYGRVAYAVKLISSVYLNHVAFTNLRKIAERPDVAMIEWQRPNNPEIDTATRAVQARKSVTYAGKSAEDLGLDGTGVTIAFVGTGISSPHNADQYSAMSQLNGKFMAGFDATNPGDPGDGTTDPQDIEAAGAGPNSPPGYHESYMAAVAVGSAAPAGSSCEPPTDGSANGNCAGIAPGAKYVNVAQCNGTSGCDSSFGPKALDWIGSFAAQSPQSHIRVVNLSYTNGDSCPNDDGSSSIAEQANYLAANGLAVVAAMPNKTDCSNQATAPRIVLAPGSASFAIAVNATDDKGTVTRSDDTAWSATVKGPRCDYDGTCPSASTNPNVAAGNLYALKPDISAPGGSSNAPGCSGSATYPDSGGLEYFSNSHWGGYCGGFGTSPATAIVSGAAALVLQKFPLMQPDSLKWLLDASADKSRNQASETGPWGNWDDELGWGILDVGDAISSATANATDLTFTNCTTGSSAGQPCNLGNGAPAWDNEVDITTSVAPQQGAQTTVTTLVKNNGTKDAHNVVVNFGAYVFGVGSPVFYHIGTQVISVIPAGTTATVTQNWTPMDSSHQCIQVSIAYGYDSDYSNNMTQRNFELAQSHFDMHVENHFFARTEYQVQTRPDRAGWTCQATPANFTMQPDDCPTDVQVQFNAPQGAAPGQAARCQVAVYATPAKKERKLLGGVTVETYVGKPCITRGEVVTAAGRPVAGARVRITSAASADETPDPRRQPNGARNASGTITTETDADGVFTVSMTPGISHTFTVEKAGVGRGETKLVPACGLGLPWLVLGEKGLAPSTRVPGALGPVEGIRLKASAER